MAAQQLAHRVGGDDVGGSTRAGVGPSPHDQLTQRQHVVDTGLVDGAPQDHVQHLRSRRVRVVIQAVTQGGIDLIEAGHQVWQQVRPPHLRRLLRDRAHPVVDIGRQPLPGGVQLTLAVEQVQRHGADRLEQAVARRRRTVIDHEERRVDQSADQLQALALGDVRQRIHHCAVEEAGAHGQPGERHPIRLVEQIDGPIDRVADTAMRTAPR